MLSYWNDLTSNEFRTLDPQRAVALMPVAATEQHGPHLSVSVDADINAGVIAGAAEHLAKEVDVFVLPPIVIGKSNEHAAFPGTLTVGPETLLRYWLDVARSVYRSGFRKIVILNSHGGQPQLVEIAVRELRVELGMLAVAANTYGLGVPDGLFDADELLHGIHAGALETGMMMHAQPTRVRLEHLANFSSIGAEVEAGHQVLRLEGAVNIGWMTQDINPAGAAGNALNADPDHGRQVFEHAGRMLALLLQEVSLYPAPGLKA